MNYDAENDDAVEPESDDRTSYGPEADEIDPIRMGRAKLQRMGFRPMSPLRALRQHCLECCGNSSKEVALCCSSTCAQWPFRLGRNPWIDPKRLTEEQRTAAVERLAAARAARSGAEA